MNFRRSNSETNKTKTVFKLFVYSILLCPMLLLGQNEAHPRIYTTNDSKDEFLQSIKSVEWKKELVKKKKIRLEKYIKLCEEKPEWLISRLQMNWKTKHNEVYLKKGDFAYSKGSAPVPTVRFSGTRDWASDYKRPKLEDVIPYLDDERGLFLEHKDTGKKEWVHPSKAGFAIEKINEEIMGLVEDAAFMFWLTGEHRYAKFAAPVFLKYIDGMHYRNAPIDLKNSTQQNISGLTTFEVIHEGIVVSLVTTYDFLYNYFKSNNTSLDHSVAVLQKWGDQIIKNGIPDNNWNLFQARFLTYIALVLEKNEHYKNGKGQEYFLDHTFNISTDRQISIKESLLVYDQETAMWPECASYSVHVATTLLRIFTLLDQATNKNEFLNYPIVEKAVLASFQYLFPSGYMVGFGDSHHRIIPPENFELLIANYRKYDLKDKEVLISGLLSQAIDKKLYTRKAKGFFELFFYVDDLNDFSNNDKKVSIESLTTPTFYAPNVSMLNQRMGEGDNAIMLSTVGSYGNHAHANGISLELFANNYVLGPDMGRGPSYWHPAHREYYSRFPAHNTVIIDGKSDYAAMRTYHPFKIDNVYPKSGENASFDKITFSKVSFFEPETVSNQQRFTAIVKSKNNAAYIVDVFRSRKQKEGNQTHEYFYHNLGQSLNIYNKKDKELKLSTTNELTSKQGHLKGYDYLTDKFKAQTSDDLNAVFKLKRNNDPDNIMKLWVKGSPNQTVYKVNSPKSNAIEEGTAPKEILEELIPTLILKRHEAAWENPFAVVYNPYIEGKENPVVNVSYASLNDYPNAQIIDVELNDSNSSDRITVNVSDTDVASNNELYQKGLLSVVRQSKSKDEMEFLFLSGMNKFAYKGWNIIASGEPFSFSLEKTNEGFEISNDNPITINMPYSKGSRKVEIHIYEGDKLVAKRTGTKNRNNPSQVVFKLSKAYDKVLIVK
ncbi:MAG: heparinase II/III family protein [Algibacter sp.]